MSCPDPYDPTFSLCFVCMTGNSVLEATLANPTNILLASDGVLRLTVDHVSFTHVYSVSHVHVVTGYSPVC